MFPVSAAIEWMTISDVNHTTHGVYSPLTIQMVENQPSTLHCTSFGGYPPPNLEMYVGSHDITSQLLFVNDAYLSGSRGFRQINIRTQRWTSNYIPRHTDDNEHLKCTAKVPGLQIYTEFILLTVECKYNVLIYLKLTRREGQ